VLSFPAFQVMLLMLLLYLAVVKQIPRKLASTDTRQSAADIVSVRLLVHGRTVQRLAL
jgi:hypothetical protein